MLTYGLGAYLFANEYTLWALNYGYCELELEKHPKAIRLSKKLNKCKSKSMRKRKRFKQL